MNFRDWVKSYCDERGMSPADCEAVAAKVAEHPAAGSMQDRWEQDVAGYPESVRNVLSITVDRVALEHIESTCPQAWYKVLFGAPMPS